MIKIAIHINPEKRKWERGLGYDVIDCRTKKKQSINTPTFLQRTHKSSKENKKFANFDFNCTIEGSPDLSIFAPGRGRESAYGPSNVFVQRHSQSQSALACPVSTNALQYDWNCLLRSKGLKNFEKKLESGIRVFFK